jgi:Phage portal protein
MVKSMPNPPSQDGRRVPISVKWPSVFESAQNIFSPGEPQTPVQQESVRSVDFPSGINSIITPRASETFGFAELRAWSNVELVRLAIETRKDQVENLDWQIKPRKRLDGQGKQKTRKDALDRIRQAEKFFRKPNREDDFSVWLRIIMEDLLVLDAPAVEMQKTRGGELYALEYMPGDTIKLLVDHNGRRPKPPAPAFQQIIKGRVWANLTSEEMIYYPRNPRSGKMYGMSPVETCIVSINTIMRRQASQIAYFSDGNIPAGMATVPDGWTVDQTQSWQEWMDANFSGNLAERRKILWAPAGSKYQPFKEAPLKDDFDEWLARIIAFAFSLPPTPFIKQMNRSTANADSERALKEGLGPLLGWAKRLIDFFLQNVLGFPDLEFSWEIEEEINAETQASINDKYLRGGVVTINEVRDSLGMDSVADGDTPLIYTAKGAVTLDMVLSPPIEPVDNSGGSAKTTQDTTGKEQKTPDDDRIAEIAAIAGGIDSLRKSLMGAVNTAHYSSVGQPGA